MLVHFVELGASVAVIIFSDLSSFINFINVVSSMRLAKTMLQLNCITIHHIQVLTTPVLTIKAAWIMP